MRGLNNYIWWFVMKIYDFETVKNICSNMNYSVYAEWVEYALKNKADFYMPPKSRINQSDGDYYAIMPCMYENNNIAMVKMIGRHIIKPYENPRSIMMSDMLIYQADTGILKAVMDGEYITTLRTGAAAAYAAKLLGRKGFKTIGLIGLGNIMTVCLETLLSIVNDRKLTVKLYKHNEQEIRLSKRFEYNHNVKFEYYDTYEETIRDSEVIISAVTRMTENFCEDDCYMEGCTVIPIMTLGFQNCDLFFDKVYTDEIEQIRNFKYFDSFKFLENATDVINGIAKGRENSQERILVYFYGLAIHDLYFAMKILELGENGIDVEYNYCMNKFFLD